MLHFVIGCAIVVGVWYQWILPERRARAQTALGLLLLDGVNHEDTPALRRKLNRLRRRAGVPVVPEPPEPPYVPPLVVPKPALTIQQLKRRATVRVSCCAGAVTAIVLTGYSILTGG